MSSAIEKLNVYSLKGNSEYPNAQSLSVNPQISYSTEIIDDYTIDDFLLLFPEFANIMKQMPILQKTFEEYKKQSKVIYTPDMYGDDTDRMVGLYIAHNLINTFRRMKNIDNELSPSSQNASETVSNQKGGKSASNNSSKKNNYWEYYKTSDYGILLYNLINTYTKVWGIGVR